jgi:acyl transferase domain-containing protein
VTVPRQACVFPGSTSGPDSFAALCFTGGNGSVEIPLALWDVEELYDPDNVGSGSLYTKHGGFIEGVDLFDHRYFRIAPAEA